MPPAHPGPALPAPDLVMPAGTDMRPNVSLRRASPAEFRPNPPLGLEANIPGPLLGRNAGPSDRPDHHAGRAQRLHKVKANGEPASAMAHPRRRGRARAPTSRAALPRASGSSRRAARGALCQNGSGCNVWGCLVVGSKGGRPLDRGRSSPEAGGGGRPTPPTKHKRSGIEVRRATWPSSKLPPPISAR